MVAYYQESKGKEAAELQDGEYSEQLEVDTAPPSKYQSTSQS